MAIYLHYLDRELGESVGFQLSPVRLIDFTNTLLIFAYEQLYCGLSLLWEQPASKQSWNYVKQLLQFGHLNALTAYPSAPDFLDVKRQEYAHQVERYPAYFSPAVESDILSFENFSRVLRSTTVDLVRELTEWASNQESRTRQSSRLPIDEAQGVARAVLTGLEKRNNLAITIALFRPGLKKTGSKQSEREVARAISIGYTKHYLDILNGVAPTGIPQLTFYDEYCRSFPYLDSSILASVVRLLGIRYPTQKSLQALLGARGSEEHTFFVNVLRETIAMSCPKGGETALKRSRIVERLLHCAPPNRPLRDVDDLEWRKRFVRWGEYVARLKSNLDRLGVADTLWEASHMDRKVELTAPADILFVTATKIEMDEVLKRLNPPSAQSPLEFYGANTYFRGRCGHYDAVAVRCEQGSIGRDASILVVEEAIRAVRPRAVVMTGIAFGADAQCQKFGDVLVSKWVMSYEPQRVGTDSSGQPQFVPRGPRSLAGPVLSNRFRDCSLGWSDDGASIQFGLILSGEKLVDNVDLKRTLLSYEPEAIGGEMEGAGLYAAAERKRVEWILVKAIADWGDGSKKDSYHRQAASHAASLAWHVLSRPQVLDGCRAYDG